MRTAAFKNWFGDWEHDPENASKVVDENGEPRVVYHGSGAKFNTFSHKFAMKNGAVKGRGFYFTDDQGYAEGFAPKGGHLFKVFLNLRNPFDAEKLSLSKKDVERVIEHLDPDGDLIVSDYASSANGYPGKAWYRKALKETVDAIVDSSVNDADIISELYTIGGQEAALRAVAETLGRDGFMSRGPVNMQIVFSSTQIKSATDNRGTYDPKNPDITFSVIGPNAAAWGKYADKAFAGRDDGKLRAEIDASQASLKAPENFPFLSMFDEWSRGMGYRKNPVWRGLLEDVLNFDELYEAYPSLRKMYVFAYKNKKDSARGYYDSEERSITINLAHIGPTGAQLSTLLHEIQHAIQDIEGFARGSNLEEGRSLDDYMRSAGEIESRNVEKRILWDGERRESKPFNDTLEFPGEAIVSFSIASAQEQGLFKSGHFEAGNAVIFHCRPACFPAFFPEVFYGLYGAGRRSAGVWLGVVFCGEPEGEPELYEPVRAG